VKFGFWEGPQGGFSQKGPAKICLEGGFKAFLKELSPKRGEMVAQNGNVETKEGKE